MTGFMRIEGLMRMARQRTAPVLRFGGGRGSVVSRTGSRPRCYMQKYQAKGESRNTVSTARMT